jgi:hypothetical protein
MVKNEARNMADLNLEVFMFQLHVFGLAWQQPGAWDSSKAPAVSIISNRAGGVFWRRCY